MKLWAVNEWASLRKMVVGIGTSMGGVPDLADAYDPKSKEHIAAGTFPSEEDVSAELNALVRLLEDVGIEVLRPHNIDGLNQVFARDVGVVIEDKLVVTGMIADRAQEWEGIAPLLQNTPASHRLVAPPGVRVEGGDVMPMDGELWVGYSPRQDFDRFTTSRTNEAALDWLSDQFPDWNVRGFALTKSDEDPRANALHLDCRLSVMGGGEAILHANGFREESDLKWLRERFGDRRLEVDAEQMYDMQCNLISIDPQHVVSCPGFESVNAQLQAWGYHVATTPMQETAKMEGLLRCVTLPLHRI